MYLEKLSYYCLWLFVNHANWWGGPQDLPLCLQNTVAKSIERKLLYQSAKRQKSVFLMVLSSLWLQSWHLRNLIRLNALAKGLAKEFFWFFSLIYFYHTWLGMRNNRFKFCPVCELCSFTIHWLSTLLDRKLFLFRAMDWYFGQTLHLWLEITFFVT